MDWPVETKIVIPRCDVCGRLMDFDSDLAVFVCPGWYDGILGEGEAEAARDGRLPQPGRNEDGCVCGIPDCVNDGIELVMVGGEWVEVPGR